jgi:hypothetical protein
MTIPAGYWRDGRGRLIPEAQIKPIDRERHFLVQQIVMKAAGLNEALRRFKIGTFDDINAFVELSMEQYGAKLGGRKGNVSLLSFDGAYKVELAIQDSITFDERLQAAKALIDECLANWTAGASPELATLINEAFVVDRSGQIRTGMILSLRRYDIKDASWQRAMQAISDAVQVTGSKSYIRVYQRVGDTDEYQPISLNIAAV